ncbi:hypothetical protein B9K01_11930 [Staphylococcus capitis]|nr:hypothetical protein B9K01_11930 [Staphylococcus capitis]
MFISEIVHTEDSFLLKLYYKFNFATEPSTSSLNKQPLFFNNGCLFNYSNIFNISFLLFSNPT